MVCNQRARNPNVWKSPPPPSSWQEVTSSLLPSTARHCLQGPWPLPSSQHRLHLVCCSLPVLYCPTSISGPTWVQWDPSALPSCRATRPSFSSLHCWMDPSQYLCPAWTLQLRCCCHPAPTSPDISPSPFRETWTHPDWTSPVQHRSELSQSVLISDYEPHWTSAESHYTLSWNLYLWIYYEETGIHSEALRSEKGALDFIVVFTAI